MASVSHNATMMLRVLHLYSVVLKIDHYTYVEANNWELSSTNIVKSYTLITGNYTSECGETYKAQPSVE